MIPDRPWLRASNAGRLIDDAVILTPEQTAVITEDGTELSYRELDDRAARVAEGLRAIGVGSGEVVALALGNDWRFAECLLGVLRLGAVSLLVNIKLGESTLAYVIAHSDAKVLIVGADMADRVASMRLSSDRVEHVIAVGSLPGARAYADAFDARVPSRAVVEVDPDTLAVLMYTSGSTGRPKGVMLSHANTWWQARSSALTFMHERRDRALVMGPLYHANALWGSLLPMFYVGGGVVILREFDPSAALRMIELHGVTYTSGTPSMYALLLAHAAARPGDYSSIEVLGCGSAPVPEELMTRLVDRFSCEVCETYGLTEGGANVITPRWGIKKLGSTGLPVPDVELKVCAPEDQSHELPPGVIGELWTRSPANALGYLKDPALTAERFTVDGWLRTADLVKRDEQGYVYFCGRTDDMISVGGENVYPKEVETILLQHPDVADCGVVPVAHSVKGAAPVAWVVPRAGTHPTEEELRHFFLERGPAYAHPRRVLFRDALPMSATNKLDRGRLEQEAAHLLPGGLDPSERSIARAREQ